MLVVDPFLSVYYRSHIEVQANGCWHWTGRINRDGYGVTNRHELAHRRVYFFLVSSIPKGYEIHHKETCQKKCVNPEHLTAVTRANHPDSPCSVNRNKTHCPSGHPYSGTNLYVGRNGKRHCRICDRIRHRR